MGIEVNRVRRCSSCLVHATPMWCVLVGALFFAVMAPAAEPCSGVLTLVNGDALRGQVRPSDRADQIVWQGDAFAQPLHFPLTHIKAIRFQENEEDASANARDESAKTQWTIELISGDVIHGVIKRWGENAIEVISDQMPVLSIRPTAVRRIHRAGLDPKQVFEAWFSNGRAGRQGGDADFVTTEGEIISGTILGIEPTHWIVKRESSEETTRLEIGTVEGIRMSTSAASSAEAQLALYFHAGARLSGTLKAIEPQHWQLESSYLAESLRVPCAEIRSMVVFQNESFDETALDTAGRLGRLEVGEFATQGKLVASEASQQPTVLRWKPLGASNAAALHPAVAGRIVYRKRATADPQSLEARAEALQQQRLTQQRRGLNFGELFLRRVDSQRDRLPQRDAHRLHMRSGDVFSCRVEGMDDRGVKVSTSQGEEATIAPERIKAIEFSQHSPPPDLEDAKRERLLTIPRLQKQMPPTHLLCSHSGDFLRCHLLGIDRENAVVELGLQQVSIPRERISQIIWFHPEDATTGEDEQRSADTLEASPSTPSETYRGKAQVLLRDDKRVTFVPTRVTPNAIEGRSDVIGLVEFAFSDIDELILGAEIAEAAAQLPYQQWQLRHAVEPLVSQVMKQAAERGSQSPLVGKQAPEFALPRLDGRKFRLSEQRGTPVLVNFWASWSAEAVKQLPQLAELEDRFADEPLQMVFVNLQDAVDQIVPILERQGLSIDVVLDRDGVVAQAYDAQSLPQTILVDAEGTIQAVWSGGGQQVVEEIQQELETRLRG